MFKDQNKWETTTKTQANKEIHTGFLQFGIVSVWNEWEAGDTGTAFQHCSKTNVKINLLL